MYMRQPGLPAYHDSQESEVIEAEAARNENVAVTSHIDAAYRLF